MADKVIDLLSRQPHMTGTARCLHCKHEWTAVAPLGSMTMECPECSLHKGVFVNNCAPEEGLLWTCNCGNQLYFIQPDICTCCNCGLQQEFK